MNLGFQHSTDPSIEASINDTQIYQALLTNESVPTTRCLLLIPPGLINPKIVRVVRMIGYQDPALPLSARIEQAVQATLVLLPALRAIVKLAPM